MKIPNFLENFLCFTLLCFYCHFDVAATNSSVVSGKEAVPAVIIFGDSIVDPGNNNYINTVVKCNFPPYGEDMNGGIPTGRFSNGKVASDYIVEEFGVKNLLPAYLDPKLTTEELLTGVSFASGASGYDPLTSELMTVLSPDDQIKMFKEYIKKIKAAVGDEKATTILSKSIVIVCFGSDDIANTYFTSPFQKVRYDIPSYTDLMLRSATSFLQQLYDLGARKIGVISVPAIGCVPSQMTLGGGVARDCSKAANTAAVLFNSKLLELITSLGKKYSDSKFVYLDIYNPFLALVGNPKESGFEEVKKGCCGTGYIEVSILCNPASKQLTCKDPDKYVFWDSFHPTDKAYKILTHRVISKDYQKFF